MIEFLTDTDTRLFIILNGIHSPFWDKVMLFVSGKPEWIPLYLAIVSWIIYKFRWKSLVIIFSVLVLITLSDQLSVKLFKETVHRLRPCHQPEIQSLVHLVKNYCGGMYGFLSNHAANSFALAAFTSLIFRNRLYTVLIFLWAGIVSYSRIYLGVHYPGDVIAGAIFGLLLAKLVYYILVRIDKRYVLKLNL